MEIKVAVIIPTFNRPKLLRRAVRSVSLQNKPPDEVIIVNDGDEVDLEFDIRVKKVKTSGRIGLNKARNLGLSVMSPDINAICYLDDDDELLPNHISTLLPLLESGNEFAFSRAMYRHRDGTETTDPEPGNKGPKRYYDPGALLVQNIAPVSSFMHTMRACNRIGGWDSSVLRLEDWDFWGRMFIQFGPPAKADDVTNVIYRDSAENMTDSNPYVYAMACHWRDVVNDRLNFMSSMKNGRLVPELKRFNPPKVGVVMPCHNASRYLPEAMDSILAQTYGDFEVVAIDDCSSDDTWSQLQDYSKKDRRVRPFRSSERLGVTRALNMGLLYSRSELVARMDADDVSMPERFEVQVNFMDKNPDIWIVGSRFWSMDETLKKVNWDNDVPTDPDEIRERLLHSCCIGHPTVMMRRRLVESIGGYDESESYRAVEDYELWLRASRRYRIANVPQYLLKYREHSGQVTRELGQVQKNNLKALIESNSKR